MAEITSDIFGTVVNHKTNKTENVTRYTMKTGELTVRLMSYGATICSIEAPDRDGRIEDVVLGFDSVAGEDAKYSTHRERHV